MSDDMERNVFEQLDAEFAKDPADGITVRTEDWRAVVQHLRSEVDDLTEQRDVARAVVTDLRAARSHDAEPVAWVSKQDWKWFLESETGIDFFHPRHRRHLGDIPLYAQPPSVEVPEGYTLVPTDHLPANMEAAAIAAAREYMERTGGNCMKTIYRALVTAATPPKPAKPANRYGVDAPYFHGKLSLVLRDLADYMPDELARELGRLAKTADAETLLEPEFCGGSRDELAGLLRSTRALLDKLPASGNPIDGYAADLEEWYERITDPATHQEREGA